MDISVAMITISFYPSIGGAQTHTLRLSRALRERGLDVFVITRHLPGLAHYEEIDGVPTYRVGAARFGKVGAALSFIQGALAVLWRHRRECAVVHCHQMISPMTIGLLAKPLFGLRLVINPHRSGDAGDVAVLSRMRKVTGRARIAAARALGDAFVSISRDIRGELLDIGVAGGRIADIPNGVDPQHFGPAGAEARAALRRELKLPAGPLVVFAGRLVSAKGLDVLLEAAPGLLARQPEAHLLIVGDGELRASLEQQARALGLGGRVLFIGGRDDSAPYLRAADAFVLPSRAEGLPVALLEAMACGLPCVATRVGGSAELIDDRVNGRLVAAEDPEALGEALAHALSDAAEEWGPRARQRILERYALDAVADRYVELYTRLLEGTPSHGSRERAGTW